jgi:TRAP-type mannitol/chloroaromatic compound transport system permease small subunit
MRGLLGVSTAIDAVTGFIGRAVSWLILATVLISTGNAIVRKAFDVSSNAWLELQWYLFGAVFLLAAAYTLQRNEHIRIDIISGMLPRGLRNAIDLLGHTLMLMPLALLMVYESYGFVRMSFLQQENSPNAGGLILWPAKALIFAGFFLLALQGISEIIKRIAVMRGIIPDPYEAKSSEEVIADQLNLVQGRGE